MKLSLVKSLIIETHSSTGLENNLFRTQRGIDIFLVKFSCDFLLKQGQYPQNTVIETDILLILETLLGHCVTQILLSL